MKLTVTRAPAQIPITLGWKEKQVITIICLNSFQKNGKLVTEQLGVESVGITQVRFGNGEAKVKLDEDVSRKDVVVLADIGNYSGTYKLFGKVNRMTPDENFQDIKRVISAINGKANSITVIMPLLYASRQHRCTERESSDCVVALWELKNLGVSKIITVDAHDPSVGGFDNICPAESILKGAAIDSKNLIVISPDKGARQRASVFARIMGCKTGTFDKRRNEVDTVVDLKYSGAAIPGKRVLVIDDIIASGETILKVAKKLKNMGASEINIISTFAFFNNGLTRFNSAYKNGFINKVYSTNLSYISDKVQRSPWFKEIDLTPLLAEIIEKLRVNL